MPGRESTRVMSRSKPTVSAGMPRNVPGDPPVEPDVRGARQARAGLAWNDDDHLTRRPPAGAARRVAGRAAPAAARPRRARAGRRLRAGHPGPVPGVGGPRAGRAGPVHPPDPRRRPAHPGPGRRHHLHRRRPRHGHRRAAAARADGRPGRRRPAAGAVPAVRPGARAAVVAGRRRGRRRTRPGWAGRRRSWTRARPRSARTRRSCAGRCWPRRRRPGRSWTGWPPARRWAACRRARCRHRRSARRTAARRPDQRRRADRLPGALAGRQPAAGPGDDRLVDGQRHGRAAPRGRPAAAPRQRPARAAAHQPAAGGRRRRASRRPSTRPGPGRPWRWSGTPRRCWSSSPPSRRRCCAPAASASATCAGWPATAGLDEPTTALLLEVAYAAGLAGELEMPGAATSRYGADQQVLPTGGYEVWRAASLAQRWEQLARAWLTMTRQAGLVGQRDDRDRPITALSAEAERAGAPAARRAVLGVLADLRAGDRAHPGRGAGPAGLAGAPAQPGPGGRAPGGAGRGGAARRDRAGRAHLVRAAAAGRR